MDLEHWKRVEQIYHLVLDSPVERRAATLEECCGSNSKLHREVESLLNAREEAGNFLSAEGLHAEIAKFDRGEPDSAVGTSLGDYQIADILGIGGMGVVYRARDTRLDRQVALKILPPYFTHDRERVARFRREARAASTLNHPNIVTIYEIGQIGGNWFIAAELIEGVTVRDRLWSGSIPVREALQVAVQCALALETAHRAGILHRDIKPENIMVRSDGVVKLVDFGLARISETGGDHARADWISQLTRTTTVIGTPRYMSPEQARGETLDGRSDIFSLGAVLYEMLSGRPAIEGATTAEIFAALLNTATRSAYGYSPWARTELDRILSKALERDPHYRYRSMAEFADDLKTVDPGEILDSGRVRRWKFSKASRAIGRHRWRAAAVLFAGLTVAFSLSFYRSIPRRVSSETALNLVPLTSFAGSKDFAAFSPDGSRIAFSWSGGKPGKSERHIHVKLVGAGEPRQLTFGSQDDTLPAWSPDGRNVAFLRRVSSRQYAVHIVPSAGGAERMVSEAGQGVSWSPDGKWLALAGVPAADGSAGLFLLSLETGNRRQLTVPKNVADYSPVYSPDGQSIAFLRQISRPDVFVISTRDSTQTAARRLTSDFEPKLPALSWTPDGREIVYSTQREFGGAGLWRVPLEGGASRRISATLQFAGNPSVSPKGNRLAYTESWLDSNIYVSEGRGFNRSGVPARFGEPVKLIASSREDHSPVFSPDGERIAFVSNRTGHSEIWSARRDGSQQVQITHLEGFAGTPRWSPDGKWIAFDCLKAGNVNIYLIGAEAGVQRQITKGSAYDTKPSWSPDGAWIYFNSDRSGSLQIWRTSVDGGPIQQVTNGGGREALLSPDGRTVYYTKHGGGAQIWSVPAAGGREQPLNGLEKFDRIGRAWGVLPEGIYFVYPGDGSYSVRFFDFANRHVTGLSSWQESAEWTGPAIALSRDGRYQLSVRTDQEINDLMMIENFR